MKIFDCFLFHRELELLELRLMELYDTVDYFIIVEATRSFRGQPHDPVYLSHRKQFADYADKIVHVLVEDMPIYQHQNKVDWRPEHFARNAIERGLNGRAQSGDRILISDVDEIPSREAVRKEAQHSENVAWMQDMYYYYVNTKWTASSWHGTVMISYGNVPSCQFARDIKRRMKRKIFDGMHCSYAGTFQDMIAKVSSYSHADDWVSPEITLKERRENLQHPTGLPGSLTVVDPPALAAMPAWMKKYPSFVYNH